MAGDGHRLNGEVAGDKGGVFEDEAARGVERRMGEGEPGRGDGVKGREAERVGISVERESVEREEGREGGRVYHASPGLADGEEEGRGEGRESDLCHVVRETG